MKRYKVIDGSESAHCCFEATVVDTHNLDSVGDPENIAETFDGPCARMICDALNATEDRKGEK